MEVAEPSQSQFACCMSWALKGRLDAAGRGSSARKDAIANLYYNWDVEGKFI